MKNVSNQSIQIAIDGPVAAGKGTVAKKLAEKLGYLYVDTGATYRMAALLALRNGVSVDDEDKIAELVADSEIGLSVPSENEKDGRFITAKLNGEDVSWEIRSKEVDVNVPKVAALAKVREELVKKQQEIAAKNNVVMEGRDITYRVLPKAQLKIYLDASLDERVRRRVEQLKQQGKSPDEKGVAERIKERDELDMNREADPLKRIDDAWYLDTTALSIDQVVDMIGERVSELQV